MPLPAQAYHRAAAEATGTYNGANIPPKGRVITSASIPPLLTKRRVYFGAHMLGSITIIGCTLEMALQRDGQDVYVSTIFWDGQSQAASLGNDLVIASSNYPPYQVYTPADEAAWTPPLGASTQNAQWFVRRTASPVKLALLPVEVNLRADTMVMRWSSDRNNSLTMGAGNATLYAAMACVSLAEGY
jgi:hypothetical protein